MYYLPYLIFQKLHDAAINARRRNRNWKYFAFSAAAGLFAGTLAGVGLLLTAFLLIGGLWWLAVFIFALMVLPPTATLVIRHITVPLGLYRASFYLGSWFARTTGKDAAAYGHVVAAWAIVRMRVDRTGPAEAWLAARRDARIPLGDGEVAATALVTAGRGDLAGARMLMQSVAMMVETHPAVRELVGEWLAVDAAARGAWGELARAAEAGDYPATPLAFFLEGIAACKTGAAGAPAGMALVARWMLAPKRRATWPLLVDVRARAAEPPAAPPPAEPSTTNAAVAASDTSAPPDRPPLPRAVAAHLALGDLTGMTGRGAFAHAVGSWDAALADEATYRWLADRARVLAAPLGAADRALRDLQAAIVEQLVAIADEAGLGAPAAVRGLVSDALAHRLRHGRLDSLEAGFVRWSQRRADGAVRLAIDEWREFVALRAAYMAAVAVAGADLRRLAYQHAFTNGNRMAAWLWNARSEYGISHAISRWLYDEALAVGDTEAIELGHRNVSLEIPTKLGRVTITPPPKPGAN